MSIEVLETYCRQAEKDVLYVETSDGVFDRKTQCSYVTVTNKLWGREGGTVQKTRDSLSQARAAQNLLSLYEKNSKTTRRYWAARCIS